MPNSTVRETTLEQCQQWEKEKMAAETRDKQVAVLLHLLVATSLKLTPQHPSTKKKAGNSILGQISYSF